MLAKFRKWPLWPAIVSTLYPKHLTIRWLPDSESEKKPQSSKFSYDSLSPFSLSSVDRKTENGPELSAALACARKMLSDRQGKASGRASVPEKKTEMPKKRHRPLKPSYEYIVVKGLCHLSIAFSVQLSTLHQLE